MRPRARRAGFVPICLTHGTSTPPRIEAPELEGFDRIEVAYYQEDPNAPTCDARAGPAGCSDGAWRLTIKDSHSRFAACGF